MCDSADRSVMTRRVANWRLDGRSATRASGTTEPRRGDAPELLPPVHRRTVRSVRELTNALDVSQSAVSQHLRALREAGLVAARPVGARRLYRVDRDGLGEVRAWVDSFWDDILTAFAAHTRAAVTAQTDMPTPKERG